MEQVPIKSSLNEYGWTLCCQVRNNKDPVAVLLDVYIEANRLLLDLPVDVFFFFQNVCVQRLAAEDEEFASEARNAFAKLEEGDQQSLKDWEICRHLFSFLSYMLATRRVLKFCHLPGKCR